LSRPSESRPWSREVGLDDWRPDAGPPARPVPARPAHGSPRLPAAYRRQALTELMTIWSFRPTPGRVRAHWARPGPAGSGVAPRGADPPKCRFRRAGRGPVVDEGCIHGVGPLQVVRRRAPGAWANLVLLPIQAHHSDHRSTSMVTARPTLGVRPLASALRVGAVVQASWPPRLVPGRRPAGPARPGPPGSWQPQATSGIPAASSDRAHGDLVLQADSRPNPGPLGPARPSRFKCGVPGRRPTKV
jgi:hypothetical protein